MARIGEIIRVLRIKRGYSQAQLAEMMGLKRSAISNYEQGIREPDLDTVEAFADFFDVSVADLIGRDETIPDDELWEIREELRRNPEYRSMLSLTKGATKREMEQIKQMIKVIRGSNSYDETDTP